MPRYHFHIHDGSSIPDREGSELPDDDAARREAIAAAGAMLAEMADSIWDHGVRTMHVVEGDRQVCILTFTAKS